MVSVISLPPQQTANSVLQLKTCAPQRTINIIAVRQQSSNIITCVLPDIPLFHLKDILVHTIENDPKKSPAAEATVEQLSIYLQADGWAHSLEIAYFRGEPDLHVHLRLALLELGKNFRPDWSLGNPDDPLRIVRSSLNFSEAISAEREIRRGYSKKQKQRIRRAFVKSPACKTYTELRTSDLNVDEAPPGCTKQAIDQSSVISSQTSPKRTAAVSKASTSVREVEEGEVVSCEENTEASSPVKERVDADLLQKHEADQDGEERISEDPACLASAKFDGAAISAEEQVTEAGIMSKEAACALIADEIMASVLLLLRDHPSDRPAEMARCLARILSESVIPLRRELATGFLMKLCLHVHGKQRWMSIMQGVIRPSFLA